MPADEMVGLLHMIPDFLNYYRAKDGKKREATWEISNIGPINIKSNDDLNKSVDGSDNVNGWKHLSAMFTNGAMVAGACVSCSIVSVEGESLTLALTYPENVISEELVEGLSQDIDRFVRSLRA